MRQLDDRGRWIGLWLSLALGMSVGPSGALSVFVGQAAGDVHVIVDVTGYFR